jgi:hypothetical protein
MNHSIFFYNILILDAQPWTSMIRVFDADMLPWQDFEDNKTSELTRDYSSKFVGLKMMIHQRYKINFTHSGIMLFHPSK